MVTLISPGAPSRKGIALPIALAAIIAVGALIAGVVFAATQEYRLGRNSMSAQTAQQAAEAGLNSVVASWTPERTKALRVGFRDSLKDTVINGARVKRQWTRVSPTMFWVTATAQGGDSSLQGRALKRLNTLVRIDIPDMRIQGALTVRGNVTATGSGIISGNDMTPPGWDDCIGAGLPPSAGLVVGDSATNISTSGTCAGLACVTGTPKVVDSTIYADSNTYKNFGGFNYDSLTKLATWTFTAPPLPGSGKPAPAWSGSTCTTTSNLNWGDTSRVDVNTQCDSYFPIIWLKGTTNSWNLANEGGQGIILVDGNLTVSGHFIWTGLIIVQGTIGYSGNQSPKLTGAVLAMNRNNGTHSVAGNVVIQYSRCAVQAVTARLSTARQTKYRAWADLAM